jgi:hypothetical protein
VSDTDVLIAISIAVLLAPLLFLGSIIAAVVGRSRSGRVSPLAGAAVAFTGGVALGAMLLVPAEPAVLLPVLIVPVGVVVSMWRARRRALAGWLVAGLALPWTVLWGLFTIAGPLGVATDAFESLGKLAIGILPFAAGVFVALRGDPPPPPPAIDAPPGQPGSRVVGSIAEALRQPTLIGPFGQPEVVMLVTMVVVLLAVPFWIPRDAPPVVRVVIIAVTAAVIGAEAYVRGFPLRSRRAFEAFSWLGEWELARAREITGERVPTSKDAAGRWLAARPVRPEEVALRIEILLFADRIDEARSLLDQLPTGSPALDFERASLADLVDFRAGGDGDIPAMERAAAAIQPTDGDERLRAEVSIAAARVRRGMADPASTPDRAIEPLLEVRERLGQRADGQVGRAFRRRLIPVLLVVGLVFGLMGELFALPSF